jgi:hypothetical protein
MDIDNTEPTGDPEAQRILDAIANGEEDFKEAPADEPTLPSDADTKAEDDGSENHEDEGDLLAGKYKDTTELKKGITNLKSTLPEYVLNGMSDEALVQHYEELSKEFSGGKKHIIKDDNPAEPKPDETKPKGAKAIPDDVWVDLSQSFDDKGGLSEEQYAKLESYGIPNVIVDGYLDGLVAKQNELVQERYAVAGGEEEYNTIKAWAEDGNIDASYLASMATMPVAQLKGAMQGVKAQYDIANGSKPNRLLGNKSNNASTGSYSSQDAYIKDVNDRRYATDEAFRNKVDLKLSKSKF